jgi:hypothetical protein
MTLSDLVFYFIFFIISFSLGNQPSKLAARQLNPILILMKMEIEIRLHTSLTTKTFFLYSCPLLGFV